MTLTPEQKAEGWIEWNGGDCPIKDDRTRFDFTHGDGKIHRDRCDAIYLSWDVIRAYRIIEDHGADAEPARPTPFPADYSDLVFDATGWSQTIIVDGKRPEWLRDDDLCIGHTEPGYNGWPAYQWGGNEIAIRVRRREPKRKTVQCRLYISEQAHPIAWPTIDLIDGKPDLSTLKIGGEA